MYIHQETIYYLDINLVSFKMLVKLLAMVIFSEYTVLILVLINILTFRIQYIHIYMYSYVCVCEYVKSISSFHTSL